MNFSENLQILRKNKNMSQEQLAEKLNVSRQAVSKWESGGSYPELDKILLICEIFDCNMDTLIKGRISTNMIEEKKLYDNFYNKSSKAMSFAIGLILFGVTVLISLAEKNNDKYAILGVSFLLFCVLISIPVFIYFGIQETSLKNKKCGLTDIYSENEINSFNKKYGIMISLGVGLIILGVIIMILLYGLKIVSEASGMPVTILFILITISVSIFVYYGKQKEKYGLKIINNLKLSEDDKLGKINGSIMLFSTFLFLSLGFIFNLWNIAWVVFPLGGILCGIVSTLLSKNN